MISVLKDKFKFKQNDRFFKYCICLFFVFCAFVIKNNIFASTFSIDDYKIDAYILDNGDLKVSEYLKYDFTESVNGVYRDILYKYSYADQKDTMNATSKRYQATNIDDVVVYASNDGFNDMHILNLENEENLANGDTNVYSVQNKVEDGYRKYIKVYMPASKDDYKYVRYDYIIKNALVKYNDASELYWNFVGKDWSSYIANLDINIYWNNEENINNIKVYPHSYGKIGNVEKYSNHARINFNNIYSQTAADVRIVLPNDVLISASKTYNQNYDYSNLINIENKMTSTRKLYMLSSKLIVVLIIYAVGMFAYVAYKSNKLSSKNVKKYKKVDYYRDIPDGFSLEEFNIIQSKYNGFSNSNLFLANILNLINDKYIILDSKKKEKVLFSDSKYKYNLALNENKDFSNLSEYSLTIVNMLFNNEVKQNTDISQFKYKSIDLNDRLSKLSYGIKNKYQTYCLSLNKKLNKKFHDKVKFSEFKITIGIILFLVLVVLLIAIRLIISTSNISALVTTIFMLIPYFMVLSLIISYTTRIKDIYVDSYNNLLGLKKYLNDYSLIKDRYPIELVLWEKYLVFASLFGIAEKVSKEFKEELLNQGCTEDYINSNYPVYMMAMNSNSLSNTIASSTSNYSSGSSSSGGFSGGGGGRRWPEAAVVLFN